MARAFLTMATGRKDAGLHLRFNSKTQNGLRQVKKAADLADFIEEVHDGWNHAKGSMVAQFTKRLYRLGYTKEATDSHLQSGVLPRLVADTHAGCSRLLTSATGHANKIQPGEAWDDSVAGNLLSCTRKNSG